MRLKSATNLPLGLEMPTTSDRCVPCLSGIGLSKIYEAADTRFTAVSDIDIHLFEGEFVCLLGPSGSGKSTLLNLLSTLDTATNGQLEIDGRSIADLSDGDLSMLRNQKLGFVFQAYNLLPSLTARANVELPCVYGGIDAKRSAVLAQAALAKVGMADLGDRKPSQLSGGQQQRVAFARALVLEPKILFADEPTGALDTESSGIVVKLCSELASSGLAVLVVTHDPAVAEHADRVITMLDGRIKSDDRVKAS